MGAKLKLYFILETVFLAVSYFLFGLSEQEIWLIIAGSVIQCIILAAAFFSVLLPMDQFEKTLKNFAEEECNEEELKGVKSSIPYFKDIQCIIDKYSTLKTRKNSAKIFDKQSELTALQSQINPHFLYNTLESIRGQALIDDNVEIAKMVEALSAFFRYSISRKGNLVTLRDELANINNYIMIQRYRFNNRFFLDVVIDEEDEAAYDYLIPKLIIQPIVENAIFHGLEEKLEGGRVTIEIVVTEDILIITISDNGNGIESSKLKELNARIHSTDMRLEDNDADRQRNTGIALPNIHKRIQLLFGEEFGVNVYSTVGQGTDVEITVPVKYGRGEDWRNEEGNSENQ